MKSLDVQCGECHCKLLNHWEDPTGSFTLIVEQCKNCCEDAYDDGILIGAMHGAPKIEQEEKKDEKT